MLSMARLTWALCFFFNWNRKLLKKFHCFKKKSRTNNIKAKEWTKMCARRPLFFNVFSAKNSKALARFVFKFVATVTNFSFNLALLVLGCQFCRETTNCVG